MVLPFLYSFEILELLISKGLVPQRLSSPRSKKNDFPTARPTRLELFSDPDFLFDIFLSPLSREFETYSRLTFNFVTYSRNGFVNNSNKAFSSKWSKWESKNFKWGIIRMILKDLEIIGDEVKIENWRNCENYKKRKNTLKIV